MGLEIVCPTPFYGIKQQMHNLPDAFANRNPRLPAEVPPERLPYPASLIARRYGVSPNMARVVAQLVGWAVVESEARR